jgi:hypothetical protein
MARSKRRLSLVVDDRTRTMSTSVLLCRFNNHAWDYVPLTPSRRAELKQLGMTEFVFICTRCTSTKVELCDLDGTVLSRAGSGYCDGYLVAEKGTGHLRRVEARKAFYVRAEPDLVVG